ncbi:MAG: hypothetical protein KDC38_21915, partial [Planctomycetes bacterium]|nr:hypothetical protein [Planctomycetota bacterium]
QHAFETPKHLAAAPHRVIAATLRGFPQHPDGYHVRMTTVRNFHGHYRSLNMGATILSGLQKPQNQGWRISRPRLFMAAWSRSSAG